MILVRISFWESLHSNFFKQTYPIFFMRLCSKKIKILL
ncbi:hypothetical protein LEP1GSC074_3948 [Leptospira noguchii str. Hook]|nr:hypothetical protein LEP1GSC074_3948 [Leptospira noguchii str. Hook]